MARRPGKIEKAILIKIAEECNELAFAALKRIQGVDCEANIHEEIKDVARHIARWRKFKGA